MKILNLDPEKFSGEAIKNYKKLGSYSSLKKISRKNLLKTIHNYDVVILRFAHKFDKELLSKAKKLKLIITNTTGTDHIDEDYLIKKNIKLLSLKNKKKFLKNITASAEFTWAILMCLVRKIHSASNTLSYKYHNRNQYIGEQMLGKNIGILGYGRNGKQIANFAKSFKMNIFIFENKTKKIPRFIRRLSIKNILKISDFLVITLPLTSKTKLILNNDNLKFIKKNSYIVNTSRGDLIEEATLLSLLKNKRIKGAALDVLQNELSNSFLNKNKLIEYSKKNSNLIITPHIAGVTKKSYTMTENFLSIQAKKIIESFYNEKKI